MIGRYGLPILAFFVFIIFSSSVFAEEQASFTPLSTLPWFMSSACCVSADGAVVVGKSSNMQGLRWTELEGVQSLGTINSYTSSPSKISGDRRVIIGSLISGSSEMDIFRWTQEIGFQELGRLDDFPTMKVSAVSRDGGVIVGTGRGTYPNDLQAFRWAAPTGLVGLGFLPGGSWNASQAHAVSGDGAVVVGGSRSFLAAGNEAFRWTEAEGMVGLGLLSGGVSSYASHISDDGLVVAGNATASSSVYDNRGYRWTAESGMVDLGLLPGAVSAYLLDISADGNVAVGFSDSEAFRWEESTGMVGLGRLPGDTATSATLVSADGDVIVGYSLYGDVRVYFVWTASTGIRTLSDILAADGIDVSGWRDLAADDISDDGSTIVGNGYSPEGDLKAWVMRLPITAPIADAGGPYSGAKNTLINFDGSQPSDPDGTFFTYYWDFGDGSTGSGPTPSHAYTVSGTFIVSLIINDGVQDSAPALILVVVTNDVPVARINGPTLAYKNTLLTWDGSLSSDDNADPLTYLWDFADGTTASTSSVNHSFDGVGNYTVSLVVNDGETNSLPVTRTVTIQSKPPIADAGPDQIAWQKTNVILKGSGSSDPDGVIAKADWMQISGPKVSLSGSNTLTASFVAPKVRKPTDLVFSLAVTDDDGVQVSDQIMVTVNR